MIISNIRRLMIRHGFIEEREIRVNKITGLTYECLQCGLRIEYRFCSYCLHFCPCGAMVTSVGGLCDFIEDKDHEKLYKERMENRAGGIDSKPWKGLPKSYRLVREKAKKLRLR